MGLLKQASPKSARHLNLDQAEKVVSDLLQDAATEQWLAEQVAQIKIKAADFRNGASMDLEPARDFVAIWVGVCRGLIQDGPNYSETAMDLLPKVGSKVEMGVKLAEEPRERYIVTVQRDEPGKLTPHQARMKAETERDDLVKAVWKWISDVNDGAGYDTGDLGWTLEQMGFPAPPDGSGFIEPAPRSRAARVQEIRDGNLSIAQIKERYGVGKSVAYSLRKEAME